MLQATISKTISSSGKDLLVQAASLEKGAEPLIPESINSLWKILAPFARFERQLVYIRNMVEQSIERKWVNGYTPNGKELFINLPHWDVDDNELTDSLAHELHHLVRWQNEGYGRTLGGALVSEGGACLFAEQQSGWKAPWIEGAIDDSILELVKKQWGDTKYNHAEWFFNGPHGKWVGYRAAYHIAKKIFGDSFDLGRSVKISADESLKLL